MIIPGSLIEGYRYNAVPPSFSLRRDKATRALRRTFLLVFAQVPLAGIANLDGRPPASQAGAMDDAIARSSGASIWSGPSGAMHVFRVLNAVGNVLVRQSTPRSAWEWNRDGS